LNLILSDLKLGMSEKSLFHEFHPDAEDMFNVTCDLKMVCDKLKDRNERYKRQVCDIFRTNHGLDSFYMLSKII
jgi:DNA ligase-4